MGKRSRTITSLAKFVGMLDDGVSDEKGANVHRRKTQGSPGDENIDVSRKKSGDLTSLCRDGRVSEVDGFMQQFSTANGVPAHLQKYFAQRYRYFSLYDEGCLLDEEGWYSVTPEKIANQIAERCRCDTILDAFCGVGGNAIAFAKVCNRVVALDTSSTRLALARHNATIYGVADRIEFILADYLDFARSYHKHSPTARVFDVVFLSPPWGGPSYMTAEDGIVEDGRDATSQNSYSLKNIDPIPGDKLFRLTRQITRNIAFFLPRNVDLNEVSRLLEDSTEESGYLATQRLPQEKVEVEEEYMGGKLKALTCYFGGLLSGQDELF